MGPIQPPAAPPQKGASLIGVAIQSNAATISLMMLVVCLHPFYAPGTFIRFGILPALLEAEWPLPNFVVSQPPTLFAAFPAALLIRITR